MHVFPYFYCERSLWMIVSLPVPGFRGSALGAPFGYDMGFLLCSDINLDFFYKTAGKVAICQAFD